MVVAELKGEEDQVSVVSFLPHQMGKAPAVWGRCVAVIRRCKEPVSFDTGNTHEDWYPHTQCVGEEIQAQGS